MSFQIKVEGQEEIKAALIKFGKKMEDELQKATFEGAQIVKSHVVSNIISQYKDKTGHLKSAVITKDMHRNENYPIVSICAMDQKIAPHAHLGEYGTVPRFRKSGGTTGQMPARPFFRPAEEQSRNEVNSLITERVAEATARFEGAK
jgi:HK97 gp10 family phage protein